MKTREQSLEKATKLVFGKKYGKKIYFMHLIYGKNTIQKYYKFSRR